jgi:RNA polymerase sigma factor (sigma-70 family)
MEAAAIARTRPLKPALAPVQVLTDRRLVRRAAAGDRGAFSEIYARYHQALYRYCRSILRSDHDASDALQATMLKALTALPGEQRRIDLKPWLYRVAHNESISILRDPGRTKPLEDAAPARVPEPHQALEDRERIRALLADLTRLSDQQRGALLMKEVGELDYRQIGAALEISPGAARVAVHKARLALVQQSEGRDMECDAVRRKISEADGRVLAARRMRSHLRACAGCREFREAVSSHSAQLQAFAPVLAAPAATGILDSVLPVGAEAGRGGGLAALLGGGGGNAAGGSLVVNAVAIGVATVAVGGAVALERELPRAFGGDPAPAQTERLGAPAPGHERGGAGRPNTSNSGAETAGRPGNQDAGGPASAGGQHGEAGHGAVTAANGEGSAGDTGAGTAGGTDGASSPDTGGPPVTPGPPAGGPSSDVGLGAAGEVVPGGLPGAAGTGAGQGPSTSPAPPAPPSVPSVPELPGGAPSPPGS